MPSLGLIQHTSPDQGVIKRDILDFLINRIYSFLINSYKMFTLHNLLPKHEEHKPLRHLHMEGNLVLEMFTHFFLRFSYHFLFLVVCLIELIE